MASIQTLFLFFLFNTSLQIKSHNSLIIYLQMMYNSDKAKTVYLNLQSHILIQCELFYIG